MTPGTFSVGAALAAGLLAFLPGTASAVTVTIGTQHWTSGDAIGSGTFIGAVTGQPAPFDQFYGGDVAGPDFETAFTFTYAAPAAVFGATLTIGMFDGDFAEAGQQLSQLTFDGTDITALASLVFEAGPGATGRYGVYTLNLPASLFQGLEDGSAQVQIALTGPGTGVLGATTNNGAGMDFATLDIQEIPEASAGLLALLAGSVLVSGRRRARRNP